MKDDRTKLAEALPRGPVHSEPFDFGGGRRYKFRLLDSRETMWAIVAAQRATLEMIREQFGDEELSRDLLKTHAPNGDLQSWWTELFVLQAALCFESGAAIADGTPQERAEAMADTFTMVERHELAARYAEFADEHDPVAFTEEQIRDIVALGKKNPGLSFWSQYGSRTLRSCVDILAAELERCTLELEALKAAADAG